jgi:hypothetical protein
MGSDHLAFPAISLCFSVMRAPRFAFPSSHPSVRSPVAFSEVAFPGVREQTGCRVIAVFHEQVEESDGNRRWVRRQPPWLGSSPKPNAQRAAWGLARPTVANRVIDEPPKPTVRWTTIFLGGHIQTPRRIAFADKYRGLATCWMAEPATLGARRLSAAHLSTISKICVP